MSFTATINLLFRIFFFYLDPFASEVYSRAFNTELVFLAVVFYMIIGHGPGTLKDNFVWVWLLKPNDDVQKVRDFENIIAARRLL